MPPELLLNPQRHERGLRHTAKEVLAGLHLQQPAGLNDEFEGNLKRDGVFGRATRGFRNPWPEMLGASWRRRAVTPIIEAVLPAEPKLVQHHLGLAAGTTMESNVRVVRDHPEGRIVIVMGWAPDGPLTALFPGAAAARHNLLGTLPGRAVQRERRVHHVEMRSSG
jgi:hypothetical protein